jgi:hypothetical protein
MTDREGMIVRGRVEVKVKVDERIGGDQNLVVL